MDYLGLTRLTDIITKFTQDKNMELEVRFMKDGIPDVGPNVFNRVRSYILRNSGIRLDTQVCSLLKIRSIRDITTGKIEYMKKERHNNVDLGSIGIRISLSSEIPISQGEAKILSTSSECTIRDRERYSCDLVQYGTRIDLTKVTTQDGIITHELELECISRSNVVVGLNKAYELIFTLMNDGGLFYTTDEASNLIEFVNRTLLDFNDIKTKNLFPESEARSKISYYPFPRPRNIKHEDLKYGGIVGGKIATYSCTYKADGHHKILVFDTLGTWLVNAPNFITLVDRDNYGLDGLILEGELIPEDKRRIRNERQFLFYVYDCISIPDHGNITQLELTKRMEFAQSYCDMIRDENILENMTIKTKSYIGLTPDNFFTIIGEVLDNESNAEYETDGLIFVPNTGPYNSFSGSLPYYDRVLSKHPDIVKWKPTNMLTIDFLVKNTNQGCELYVSQGKNKLDIFSRVPIVNLEDVPNGSIVELGWNDGKVVLHRIRDDKTIPNSKDVAEATYKDILNPITEDMIRGRGFKLVRSYHNDIKKELFHYVASKGCKTLLDLGSGRGGDIGKWKHFDKIIAVEPNQDNIDEMIRRLPTYGMQDKVTIIKAGAQDTDTIKEGMLSQGINTVSCIASMLSLTFLWEGGNVNPGLLNTLETFLEPNGYFIYLVMDSDHVSELFRPIFRMHNFPLDKIDFGPAKLEWRGQNKIHVHIDDSIVTEQDEWLVKLDDLTILLPNFTEERRVRADKERLLPFNERMFSSLFTYGAYQKKQSNVTYPKPYSSRIPIVTTDPNGFPISVVGDCEAYDLACDWYSGTLVGITTIGDGSCFFHSVIKCINPQYFELDIKDKIDMAHGFRFDIADALNAQDSNGNLYYYYTSPSQFQNVSPMYKLENLTTHLLNPNEPVGDYMYGIISTLYSYDIVVLEYRNGKLVTHTDTIGNIEKDVIFLVAYDGHYESILEYNQYNQAVPYSFIFKRNSELVQKYIGQKNITKGSRK